MANSVHKSLTGADLHEPKGADTALANQVYVSDGAGSGSWVAASSIITNIAFSTGDLKPTHKTTADSTWILWSDGTIGDASSGATIRANADTAALFAVYWNGYSNTVCPVSTGRGANAAADFAAHKTLALPLGAGRVLGLSGAGSGLTSRTVGDTLGTETKVLLLANLPAYTPTGTIAIAVTVTTPNVLSGGISDNYTSVAGTGTWNTPTRGSLAATGTGTFTGTAQGGTSTAFSIMQPTSFINVMVKL